MNSAVAAACNGRYSAMTATRSLNWWDRLIGTTWSAWGAIRCSRSGSALSRTPSTVQPRTSVLRSPTTASCCTATAVTAVQDGSWNSESAQLLGDARQLVADGNVLRALVLACSATNAALSR